MPFTSRSGVDSALPKVSRPVLSSNTAMSVKVPPMSAARRTLAARLDRELSAFIPAHTAFAAVTSGPLVLLGRNLYSIKIHAAMTPDEDISHGSHAQPVRHKQSKAAFHDGAEAHRRAGRVRGAAARHHQRAPGSRRTARGAAALQDL